MIKKNKGITLIALVITVVVLIILAVVATSLALGNNGILNRAKNAKDQYSNSQEYEQTEIAKSSNGIDSYIESDRGVDASILSRIEALESKVNNTYEYEFNTTPVASVSKSSSGSTSFAASTIWFTNTNSYMSRSTNSDYFDYDGTNGFICKKAGIYYIDMYAHTSSGSSGQMTINIVVNGKDISLNERWNGNATGMLRGHATLPLNVDDTINGYYKIAVAGTNHHFGCSIYSLTK